MCGSMKSVYVKPITSLLNMPNTFPEVPSKPHSNS